MHKPHQPAAIAVNTDSRAQMVDITVLYTLIATQKRERVDLSVTV